MSRSPVIAAAVLVLVCSVGCGGTSSPGAGASPRPVSSAASSTVTSSGASPTSSPTPDVTPAVGRRYETDTFTFVVPDGFTSKGEVGRGSGIVSNASFADEARGAIMFISALGNLAGYTFEQAAALEAKSFAAGSRLPDREVGGEQVFVFDDSTSDAFTRNYAIGRTAGGAIVELSIQLVRGLAGQPPADPVADQAFIESVLATVVWKV